MLKKTKQLLPPLIAALLAVKIFLLAISFFNPPLDASELPAGEQAQRLIDLTNQYRQEQNLGTLAVNARLTQAAVNKARDILANQYFEHTSPEGKKFSDWIKEVNYQYFYIGENLAIDFNNVDEAFTAWLDSSGHRDNIVKPQYREIGLAVLSGQFKGRRTTIIVQLFGNRILGASASAWPADNAASPANSSLNYFYPETVWQKISRPESLSRADYYCNFLIVALAGLLLILYRPPHHHQINIKQPIINRYQAKIFRE